MEMTTSEVPQSKDPWEWTVDEVVSALCDPALPFRFNNNNPQAMPDATLLEQKLREHYIEGCSLLTDINNISLKEDLGIFALGPRGHIQREVQRLRWDSPRYLEYIKKRLPDPSSGHSTGKYNVDQSRVQSVQNTQQWLSQLPDVQESLPPGGALDPIDESHDRAQPPDKEITVIDEIGRKRRRLVLNAAIPAHLEDNSAEAVANTTVQELSNVQTPTKATESPAPSNTANKEDRKRITPTVIHQPDKKFESLTRKPCEMYLGIKAHYVDDLFYDRVQSASKVANSLAERTMLNEDEQALEFGITSTPASNGQRRYVKSRIQHFLRQQAQMFCRGTKRCHGIIPYPDALGPKHHSLSMTIFDATPNAILATRRDRAGWLLSGSIEVVKSDQALHNFDVDVHRLPVSLEEDNGADWGYLEKWHHVPEHDRVLPLYGESGSEGEYDLETWRLMEQEKGGKLPRPLGRSRTMKISEEDVRNAIDEVVQRMIEYWKQERLPRLLRTAWILWSKSRRNGIKRAQISSLTLDAEHLSRRLDKLRQEITKEQWISTARVSRQCESMRRTIYELEESSWKISTLQLNARPEKQQKLPKAQSEKVEDAVFTHEEQEVAVETSSTDTSEGEDLDGFIVDDDDATSLAEDANMTGQEDDDRGTSDGESMTGQPHMEEQQVNTVPKTLKEETLSQPESELKPLVSAPVDNFIDLILDSDASEPEVPLPSSTTPAVRVHGTPSAYSSPIDEDPLVRSPRKKASFKVPPGMTKTLDLPNVVVLEDDSALDSEAEPLPELYETEKISRIDPKILMERSDRKRLLIWILAASSMARRKNAYSYISNNDLASTQEGVWRTIKSLRGYRRKIRGTQREDDCDIIKVITAWFISWTNVVIIKGKDGAKETQLAIAKADKEGFEPFYRYLHELQCLRHLEVLSDSGDNDITAHTGPPKSRPLDFATPAQSQSTPKKQKRVLLEYPDNDLQPTSAKKRKFAVPESQEAANLRKRAHERVVDREIRQRNLKARLERMGQTEEDPSQVAVNVGKLEELVYLPASIGARIQPHQKDGVRFLWREIIEDHATKQGCLLAQTMGLGKTMQVISFLVAVAEAATSSDAHVGNQIPNRLLESRTIVLCPPTLIQNWYEEFLIWAPDNMAESIGEIRKVDSSMQLHERLQTIEEWGDEGGVLVLGFSVLRDLILNPSNNKTQQTPLDDDQHRTITDILLKKPNIVVADEAHAAKNRSSKLHQILVRFSTGSRIALTGSPLSNNLSEYYALIEWVAPGYLGEHREFKAHYEEPIQDGLYRDSTPTEWRKGLKMLELFKREVAPKVHRADISVLASRLKGKSEFVIKLALTPLQEELYQIFVASMGEQYKGTEGPHQATLWAWISILRLVCNHPKCFYDKLNDTTAPRKKRPNQRKSAMAEELGIADEDEVLLDASFSEIGVSDDLVQRQLKPFRSLEAPLDTISLANKMTILLQILELSNAMGDKVLVFSHSLPTLDYVGHMLKSKLLEFLRLDGDVPTARRQQMTKNFNEGPVDIFLISTRAGGTGLNLFGANRVVILDDHFNPTWEEQAIGRAYRIGQMKHVFVYRLTAGGTFEEALHNQSLFKQQLATRAVDKRNIARQATRSAKDYFQPLETVEQTDLGLMKGKDPAVLDKILVAQAGYGRNSCNDRTSLTLNREPSIRAIVPCETFQQEVDENLTAEEQKEVEQEEEMSRLRRTDPPAYYAKMAARSVPYNPRPPPFQPGLPNGIPAASLPIYANALKPPAGPVELSRRPGMVDKLASQGIVVSDKAPPPTASRPPPQRSFGPSSLVENDRNYGAPRPYASEISLLPPYASGMAHGAGSEPSWTPTEPVESNPFLAGYPLLRDMVDQESSWSRHQ